MSGPLDTMPALDTSKEPSMPDAENDCVIIGDIDAWFASFATDNHEAVYEERAAQARHALHAFVPRPAHEPGPMLGAHED